jgi:hypothetical protein
VEHVARGLGQRRIGVEPGTARVNIERQGHRHHEVPNRPVRDQRTSHGADGHDGVCLRRKALDEERAAEQTAQIGDAGYCDDQTGAATRHTGELSGEICATDGNGGEYE